MLPKNRLILQLERKSYLPLEKIPFPLSASVTYVSYIANKKHKRSRYFEVYSRVVGGHLVVQASKKIVRQAYGKIKGKYYLVLTTWGLKSNNQLVDVGEVPVHLRVTLKAENLCTKYHQLGKADLWHFLDDNLGDPELGVDKVTKGYILKMGIGDTIHSIEDMKDFVRFHKPGAKKMMAALEGLSTRLAKGTDLKPEGSDIVTSCNELVQ
jgi:hypothetical protein